MLAVIKDEQAWKSVNKKNRCRRNLRKKLGKGLSKKKKRAAV
jgi:hypothetical protein